MDPKTRDQHARLHGKVFHLDDPFWDRFTPPLDFYCRCRKRALSPAAVKRRKLKVLKSKPGDFTREDQVVSKRTGETRKVTGYKLPGGGKVVPRAGFDNNQWKSKHQPDLEKYPYDLARQYGAGALRGPAFKRFFEGKTGGKFPVAVTDPKTRKIIGAITQGVWLHADRMAHVKKGHPDISLDDFGKIQDIIENGEIITNPKGAADFLLFRKTKDGEYVIPLQVGKKGQNINSFFDPLDNGEYREHKKKIGKVLRKEKN